MMLQLLGHLWGDYLLQSDWMALNKRSSWLAASIHCYLYAMCLLPAALAGHHAHPTILGAVIYGSHLLIDRFGLARYLVWAKNWLGPAEPWVTCRATGYPPDRPIWLATWLLIIADNTLHLTCNYFALRFF